MHVSRRRIIVCAVLAVIATTPVACSRPLPVASADAAGADAISARSLYESEAWWPTRVKLTKEVVSPTTGKPIPLYYPGMLVRVERDGSVRVDFASHGQLDLPIADTDVLEHANALESGREQKFGPNLATTLANKLLDPTSHSGVHRFNLASAPADFLFVFLDPMSDAASEVKAALEPLAERSGLLIVLMPQNVSAQDDVAIRDRLLELEWPVAFPRAALVGGFTRSLLGPEPAEPYLMLTSAEGRVLYRGPVRSADAVAQRAELESSFEHARPKDGVSTARSEAP